MLTISNLKQICRMDNQLIWPRRRYIVTAFLLLTFLVLTPQDAFSQEDNMITLPPGTPGTPDNAGMTMPLSRFVRTTLPYQNVIPQPLGCGDQRVPDQGTVRILGSMRSAFGTRLYQPVAISAFNGQNLYVTTVNPNFAYCLDIKGSSPGTSVVVFYTSHGMLPVIQNLRVGSPDDGINIINAPIALFHHDNLLDSIGIIAGVAYYGIAGGRPRVRSGIYGFDQGLELRLSGRAQHTLKTNDSGHIVVPVRPGRYSLLSAKNVSIQNIDIGETQTTIVPVLSGVRRVF